MTSLTFLIERGQGELKKQVEMRPIVISRRYEQFLQLTVYIRWITMNAISIVY